MKVYIAMAVFTEDEFKRMSSVLDAAIGNFNMTYWQYLYGFTTDKKLFDKFYKIHSNLSKRVIDMSKSEYGDFRRDNKSSEISIYPFIYGITEVKGKIKKLEIMLPCSKNEFVISTDYSSEIYYADIATLAVIDPAIFKSKYMELLEYIDYFSCYVEYYGDDTLKDNYYFNRSFNISYTTGHHMGNTNLSDNDKFNEVGFLIMLFKDVINIKNLHEYIIKGVDKDA